MKAFECSAEEIKMYIEEGAIAILPIGSCEQHGPHLPVGTDSMLAEFFSQEIAKRTKALIFPTLNFGYSWVWTGLPGTLTLSQEIFKTVLLELGESFKKMGFKLVLFVNGHDSNKMAIKYVIRDLCKDSDTKFLNIFYPGLDKIYQEVMESSTWYGMFHADEFETSLMMAYDESLVKNDKLVCEYPKRPNLYGLDESPLWNVSKTGVFGDATKASKEKGKIMIERFAEDIVEKVDCYLNQIIE